MRVGAVDLLWWPSRASDPTFLPELNAIGLDALEIAFHDPNSLDVATIREAARAQDVSLSLLVWTDAESDLCAVEAAARERGIRHITQCLDVAHSLGAATVGGAFYASAAAGGGDSRRLANGARQERLRRARDGIRRLAEYAGERGITLALEPLNRYEGFLITDIGEMLEFLDAVSMKNVGVLVDTFHMHLEEASPREAILAATGRIAHVHASENNRGAPGDGQVDWAKTVDALVEADFNGTLVIESFSDAAIGIREACAMWRPRVGDPTAFVERGVRTLRSALVEASAARGIRLSRAPQRVAPV